jgi:hypothetical protein
MTRRRSVFLATAIVALLTVAPPALADDAGLFNAYVARQASEVDPASDAYVRAAKRLGKARTGKAARKAFRPSSGRTSASTAPCSTSRLTSSRSSRRAGPVAVHAARR